METPFPPFDPEGTASETRLRDIPLRTIFPNFLTLLAICSGLTAIRFAIENRIELAVAAIILAAFLDGIDGRVARFLKSTTRFGAQMDSLADFVNFGVAPAMLLYFVLLNNVRSFGWLAALIFAICACLRLARFNAALDKPDGPKWHNDFFVGVPAPAGALTVLAPVYGLLLGVEASWAFAIVAVLYTLAIALLMVSSVPTFSGKEMGKRVPAHLVLPLLLMVVAGVGLLLSYPWETLLALCLAYIICLPLGYRAWKRRKAADHAAMASDTDDNAKPE